MIHIEKEQYHERAVSETIGFILIFGIMVTGIALVTLYGYPLLLKEQQNTNVRNMERNMIVLQNDLKSLTYKSVPYKETTLQVAGGTLSVKKEHQSSDPNFTVSWTGSNIPPFYPGEIRFESQDGSTTLSLENGAVHTSYWSSPNGSAMLAEPRWFYDKPTTPLAQKTFVMTFINLTGSENLVQTGIGTVRMRLVDSNQNEYPISGKEVTIKYRGSITNNYNIAWRNYLSDPSLHVNLTDASSNLESTFKINKDGVNDVDVLVIKQYNVTILSL